jgi:hypothetical protein
VNGSGPAAEGELLDAVLLWRAVPGTHAGEVIDAACECLVAGSDTEALRELAGASLRDSSFVLDPLILRTLDELGLSDALEVDLQRSAMLVLARRLATGRITPRQLASWAHAHIGHEGSAECQPFVNFDDMYDEAECVGLHQADLDHMVREEADAYLSGAESPGLSLGWPAPPEVEPGPSDQRPRGWWRRLGRRPGRS